MDDDNNPNDDKKKLNSQSTNSDKKNVSESDDSISDTQNNEVEPNTSEQSSTTDVLDNIIDKYSQSRKRNKEIKNKKKYTSILWGCLFAVSLIICIALDIVFYRTPLLFDYDVITWAIAIVIPIVAMCITVLSVSLSLKKNEEFQLTYTELEKVRSIVEIYVPFWKICFLVVLLTFLVVFFLLFACTITTTFLITSIYLFTFLICKREISFFSRNSERVSKILLNYCKAYIRGVIKEDQAFFIKILFSLIKKYGLLDTYNRLTNY